MKKLILLSIVLICFVVKSQDTSNTDIVQALLKIEDYQHAEVDLKFDSIPKSGVITIRSRKSFEATYNDLRAVLEKNPEISIMAEIDHQKNASRTGIDFTPMKLIIFGNPDLGTHLMSEVPAIGLDLPQKMLVWENRSGEVYLSYNDPYFIAKRHSLKSNLKILNKISAALEKISKAAIKN